MPLHMIRHDITKFKCDAIVNAANNTLLGGGGVDGAIHKAAGPELYKECLTLGGCETGKAKITKGYNLPAKYVIHTVGPIWQGGQYGEEEALASCYKSSLELVKQHKIKSVAFPSISCGVYKFPLDKAFTIATTECSNFLDNEDEDIDIYLVLFSDESFDLGKKRFNDIKEYIDSHYVKEVLPRSRRLYNTPYDYAPTASNSNEPEYFDECRSLSLDSKPIMKSKSITSKEEKPKKTDDINEVIKKVKKHHVETFSEMVIRKIDESNMTDPECYKRSNITKNVFSKLRKSSFYKPSKSTALALALGLHLNMNESNELLNKAGYYITETDLTDVIFSFCIEREIYNLIEVNEILFNYGLPTLGSK